MDADDMKDILELVGIVAGDEWQFRLVENPPEMNGFLVDMCYVGGSDLTHGASIQIDGDNLGQSVIPVHQTMRRLCNTARELKHRAMMEKMVAKP